MSLRFAITTAACVAALSGFPLHAAHQDPVGPRRQPAPDEEALGGLDPVRLVEGREVDGQDALAVAYHGFVYYFSTPETKARFEQDPARYAVQLDGLCARMGPPVLGSQSLYTVHDGRVYVFGSEECQKRFVAEPGQFLDRSPSPLADATPEAAARGRALLDRAVAAVGGDAVSRLQGFRERTRQELTRMQGPVTVTTETAAIFPDSWRRETSNQYGRFLLVLTPESAFRASARTGARPLTEALRGYYRGQFGTHLLALLHAHRTQPLRARALDAVVENGITLERAAVDVAGQAYVLTLDPTGRPRSLATRGHSPQDGTLGDIVQWLSDYRPVGGLSLPFRVDTRFNGEVLADLSYTVEAVELDPAVDAAWVRRPLEERP